MKKSCLGSLLFLVVLTVAYSVYLQRFISSKGVWIFGFFGALSVLLLIGSFRTMLLALKKIRMIRHAREGRLFEDGKMIAAVGAIQPDGEPLTSPIQNAKCVAYESELYKGSAVSSSSTTSQSPRDYVYVGVAMTPCRVSTLQGGVRLLGFPLLNEFPQKILQELPHQQKLTAYLKSTSLEPMQGMKKLGLLSKLENLMTDEDGSLRQDWRLGILPDLEEKEKGESDPEDLEEIEDEEEEIDEEEEGAPEGPLEGYVLGERVVPVGEPVVALGTYSASQMGIQGRFKMRGMANELYPGTAEQVSKAIRGKIFGPFIFAVFYFLFFHGLIAFIRFKGA